MDLQLRKMTTALGMIAGSLIAVPVHAIVLTGTNSSEGIVDGASDTRTIKLDGGFVTNVIVTLDFMKCSDFTFATPLTTPLPALCPDSIDAYPNEIVFRLTSAAGIMIDLVSEDTYPVADPTKPIPTPKLPESGRVTVIFSDAGTGRVGEDGLVGETAKGVQSLSLLNGATPAGDWTLYFEDLYRFDPLGLASFSLEVTIRDSTPGGQAPIPGTLALLGLGLAGLGALSRRRRP